VAKSKFFGAVPKNFKAGEENPKRFDKLADSTQSAQS
jgi:hypothetical protein